MKHIHNFINLFWGKARIYFMLPHVLTLLVIMLLDIVMLVMSVAYRERNEFLSAIYANIFAGLLTGVIICLISTVKSVSLYRTEQIITWLETLQKECFKFLEMCDISSFPVKRDFKSDDEYYDFVYDTLCCGNEISNKISQSRFIQSLSLNPYKYCKKEFSFDAVSVIESNCDIRDLIVNGNITLSSAKEVAQLFAPMKHQIHDLNSNILKKIKTLKIKQKATRVSIG